MRTHVSLLPFLAITSSAILVTSAFGCGSDDPAIAGDADASASTTTGTDAGTTGQDASSPSSATYTVGGTVAGLEGKGLVLQNNAGDDLVVDASGAFAFKTKLTTGKAFAVTVKTQPSGPKQVCTVSGGTGSIAAGNVSSVTVNCATSTFTVGGTASGVAGTGLALQNNAGDDVVVNANGTFAFATPVKDGAAYAITVKTQPTNPSQTCAVANGSGTVAGANVTAPTVTCTTNQYTVGGAVTGLVAGSVVLTNNGGDDLAVAADGNFTFVAKVASNANYAVAVKTQPAGLYCSVTNGSGKVTNANVTNVAVACLAATSCKAIKTGAPGATSGVYTIQPAAAAYPVYCDMVTDGGGWTLALKGAAASTEFVYQSVHWTTDDTLNAMETDLDAEDAKFQAFNDLAFTDVRVATKNTNGDGTITVANPTADTTLLARFQGAGFQLTNAGRASWVASHNGTVLQPFCNRDGFNIDGPYVKARIGMEANQENDCTSSDSVVGVGVWANTSCGNGAGFSAGYHSGPGCPAHDPANPPVAGLAASFWVWIR